MANPSPLDNAAYLGFQSLETASSPLNLWDFLIRQVVGKTATVQLVLVLAVHVPDTLDGTGTVDVQPMVNQIDGTGNATPHGTIFGLPYMRLQGGANAVILDPAVGDIGMAAFCSRDISAVKSTRAVANPGSRRTFDWADGLYLGGFLNGVPTQYIQFTANGILVVSPTKVTVQAPAILLDGALEVTGAATIDSTLTVQDAVTGHSSASFDDEVTGNSIALSTHKHSGVTAGSADTGAPV